MTEQDYPDGETPVTEEEAKEQVAPPNPVEAPAEDDLTIEPATPEKGED